MVVKKTAAYLARITYINLSELPAYVDEFVGARFLPHTSLSSSTAPA